MGPIDCSGTIELFEEKGTGAARAAQSLYFGIGPTFSSSFPEHLLPGTGFYYCAACWEDKEREVENGDEPAAKRRRRRRRSDEALTPPRAA